MATVTARSLTEKLIGARVEPRISDTVSVTTSSTIILPINPARVLYTLVNTGGYNIYVNVTGAPATLTAGIYLGKNGGSLTISTKDDFDVCSAYPLTAIADSSASSIYLLEYLLVNTSEEE